MTLIERLRAVEGMAEAAKFLQEVAITRRTADSVSATGNKRVLRGTEQDKASDEGAEE